ncbi:helix-turn-helix domain-containing protein [Bradyrhizobium sp. 2S1]|uniref:helix-turn-helix domain-containing protein n=1 Tax=Bradyrhizobium sp. 2S1 TaxID=1404429 RepID=UPI001CD05ACD|nr:helix-turn-helix domain-containing protein [Bradyrhizobium sp. 2S1]MCK7673866.1 helix-turn-helix domain-containing protein [Bradyrhizobium sp. 2S1]
MSEISAAAAAIYERINAATGPAELDELLTSIWRHYWPGGAISDADAQFLAEAIEHRKPHQRRAFVAQMPIAKLHGRVSSLFKTRQRPRSPDRQASRERRRTLGSSSGMPPAMRAKFTEGQRAVLAIVAGEVKHHGECDLPYDKIAALAGVCRTTVQTTLHEARRLGFIHITERPQRGRKNLTNLVRIVSRDWVTWIKRGPAAHRPADYQVPEDGRIGSKAVKMASPTKSTDLIKKEAFREIRWNGGSKNARSQSRRQGSSTYCS